MIFMQYYSGDLLSYLTLKETYSPFRNIEEVAKDGSYKIFLGENTYIHFYLTVSLAFTTYLNAEIRFSSVFNFSLMKVT